MAEEQGKIATMSQVKRIIRGKLRKHEEHTEEGLNIYPMMDMMTILLVFLIMQFAQAAAEIVQNEHLQIPYSSASKEAEESTSLTIAANSILLEQKPVVELRNGLTDASQRQGGGNGFLISGLFSALGSRREELKLIAQYRKDRPFTGDVKIIADKRTPFRTLAEIVYTLGQAQFSKMRFVVLKKGD